MSYRFIAPQHHRLTIRASAIATVIVALAGAQNVAAAYEVVTVTNGGTIDGSVTLSGPIPPHAPVKVTKNQDICGNSIPDPTYAVSAGGGLQNVIVYLKGISRGKAGSGQPLTFVNEGCMFRPRVQGAMVGNQVTVSSNDPVLHNYHPQNPDTNATIYNVAIPFPGFSVTKPLPAVTGLIKIKCDAHEWMHAWIMELDHPYYATTDSNGHFTIKDVPSGAYTLAVWHEAAGEKSAPITVAAGQTTESKIALAAKQRT
jgi:Polysaccharide lyase family 4, domain II